MSNRSNTTAFSVKLACLLIPLTSVACNPGNNFEPQTFGSGDPVGDWGADCIGVEAEEGPPEMDIIDTQVSSNPDESVEGEIIDGETFVEITFNGNNKEFLDMHATNDIEKPEMAVQLHLKNGTIIDSRLITDKNDPKFCQFKVSDNKADVRIFYNDDGNKLTVAFSQYEDSTMDKVTVDAFNLDSGPNGQTYCDDAVALAP